MHGRGDRDAPKFLRRRRRACVARGGRDLARLRLADASREELAADAFDAALCLGASFVYGGLAATLDALEPSVRPGGHVVVGEPTGAPRPLPEDTTSATSRSTSLDGTRAIVGPARSGSSR